MASCLSPRVTVASRAGASATNRLHCLPMILISISGSTSRANEVAAVHSGKYGKLLVSKGYCCKPRWSIGNQPIALPPNDLDFNLWQHLPGQRGSGRSFGQIWQAACLQGLLLQAALEHRQPTDCIASQ